MKIKSLGIWEVAGLSLVGFCAVSVAADRVNLGPIASEVAGFCGAFLGALAGRRSNQRRNAARMAEGALSRAHTLDFGVDARSSTLSCMICAEQKCTTTCVPCRNFHQGTTSKRKDFHGNSDQ